MGFPKAVGSGLCSHSSFIPIYSFIFMQIAAISPVSVLWDLKSIHILIFFKWPLLSEYRLYQLQKDRLLLMSMASSFLKRSVVFLLFFLISAVFSLHLF